MAFRLRGKKTATWTRTAANQIGPELFATDDPRTLPSFTDLNTKYVNLSTGNDGTGTGTSAAPYLTIQAACTARKAAGGAFVYVVVAGATSGMTAAESVDLKGAKLYTAADQTHTIHAAAPAFAAASALPAGVTKVFCAIEAGGYFWVGTDDGIYTIASEGTGAWTQRAYDNKDIKKLVYYSDGYLYGLNTEDKLIVSCANPAGAPATWATAWNAAAWTTLLDLVYAGGYLFAAANTSTFVVYRSSGYGATWTEFCSLGTTIQAIGGEPACPNLVIVKTDSTAIKTPAATYTDFRDSEFSGFPDYDTTGFYNATSFYYVGDGDTWYFTQGGSQIVKATGVSTPGEKTPVALIGASGGGEVERGLYVNGIIYHGDSSGTSFYAFNVNTEVRTTLAAMTGGVWSLYQGSRGLYVCAAGASGLQFGYLAAIKDSDASVASIVNGFTVDGNGGRGLYLEAAATLEYCRVTNATDAIYRATIAAATNIVTLTGVEIDTSVNGVYITGGTGTDTDSNWTNVLIHDCSGYGVYNDVSNAVVLADHITVTRCGYGLYWAAQWSTSGAGALLENSIISGNYTADIYLLYANTERMSYTLARTFAGYAATIANSVNGNPLFRSTTDFNLQDKAGGYAVNSLALAAGDDSKDLGAYDVTRSVSYAFAEDFTFLVPPAELSRAHQVSGFSFIEDVDGNYSEYFNGLRRAWTLAWQDQTVCAGWETQADYFAYLQSLEDVAFEWGEYADSAWVPEASGSGTVSGSTISVSENGVLWAANKYAGYWIKIDSTYHRIASHPAKALNSAVTLTLDTAPTTGAQAWSIDYILVKIDKRSGIAFKRIPSTLKAWAAYSITLREVDSYGV